MLTPPCLLTLLLLLLGMVVHLDAHCRQEAAATATTAAGGTTATTTGGALGQRQGGHVQLRRSHTPTATGLEALALGRLQGGAAGAAGGKQLRSLREAHAIGVSQACGWEHGRRDGG